MGKTSEDMGQNWTPNQLKVIEWLATPRFDRIPPTQESLAANLGIAHSTLYRWLAMPGLREEANKLARAGLGRALPDAYGALIREAEKGSFQHLQLLFEMAGELKRGDGNGGNTTNNNVIIIYEGGGGAEPPYPASWTIDGVVTAPPVQRGLLRETVGQDGTR